MKMRGNGLEFPFRSTRLVFLLIWCFSLFTDSSFAQKVLDRIVAVVGNQIILESELKAQLALYATQFGMD
ncbi:MAG: hypothetical protein AMJ73_09485, partial [candidate division Zixibacteria bacterium SM1_73]